MLMPLANAVRSLSHAGVSHSCDPRDYSPLDSSVHGIFQARITGEDCHFLPQETPLTQESKLCLLGRQGNSLPLCMERGETPSAFQQWFVVLGWGRPVRIQVETKFSWKCPGMGPDGQCQERCTGELV